MVALEAIREALVVLDEDIHKLEECIEECSDTIGVNYEHIFENDERIVKVDGMIESQHSRLEALQWRCRNV